MVARTPNSERKMHDELPDVNVAAEFYALYDIREVLGKLVFTVSLEFICICCYAIEFAFASCFFAVGAGNIVGNSSIFSESKCTSCHWQGHIGCKTSLQQHPLVIIWECWL